VTYLLDISALLAWLWDEHEHHRRVLTWEAGTNVAVCPLTELGFLRISTSSAFGASMEQAREMLQDWLRQRPPCTIEELSWPTEEALKSVDNSFRHGSYALGASKLQTIRRVTLPIAYPNIITGLILSIGRVSGETAPILFTVAAYFLPKLPSGVFDQVMALPYHLYVLATSGTNIEESRPMAYGTALVLIMIVLILNLLANALRRFFSKKVKMN
jgi:hypothetical protein